MQPWDLIEDDHCWAHYYAGRLFLEGQPLPPAKEPPVRYSIVPRRDRLDNSTPCKVDENALRARGAAIVYHWPQNRPADRADVVVYAEPVPAASPKP